MNPRFGQLQRRINADGKPDMRIGILPLDVFTAKRDASGKQTLPGYRKICLALPLVVFSRNTRVK